jgi:hypothetical protein
MIIFVRRETGKRWRVKAAIGGSGWDGHWVYGHGQDRAEIFGSSGVFGSRGGYHPCDGGGFGCRRIGGVASDW